jgi:putative transposase
MTKLKNKKKLLWCLEQLHKGKMNQKWLSNYLEIKTRRFRQLYTIYKQTKQAPTIGTNVGRPKKQITEQHKQIIQKAYEKHHLNA